MKNEYYVYFHVDRDKSEIVYIGKGKGVRFNVKSNRNKEHLLNFDKLDKFIYVDNLSESDALDLENELINLFNP
ncbi:MAG TPA: hypothetical protein V6C58_04375, partial [Allocoleopsis sp.]